MRPAKRPWGNGDGRLVYPPLSAADGKPTGPILEGPVDSIRWELLRDGIEDYEYLVMLQQLIEQKKAGLSGEDLKNYSDLLEVPDEISADLTHFTTDPDPIERRRGEVARAIEKLSQL